MLTRLSINNFRCLVDFELSFDSFGVLCGPNGSGKSSLFDALKLIRDLATGDGVLGGKGPNDVPNLDFTSWLKETRQEFELDLTLEDRRFSYVLHLEQVAEDLKPRIVRESAKCDDQLLFERDLDAVRLRRGDGRESTFPLDWRQAALGAVQAPRDRKEIEILQRAMNSMLILRPDARVMRGESLEEVARPEMNLGDVISWYRSLQGDLDWTNTLRDSLRDIWPDFQSFRLVEYGRNAKALQLRFEAEGSSETFLYFDQLSDGEKALVGLYMVRASMASNFVSTVFIDEPDNYVGLPELQPWILAMLELLGLKHQVILISHHPEILASADGDGGFYLSRDHHSSRTRIAPLRIPEGLTPGEAIARGWINA